MNEFLFRRLLEHQSITVCDGTLSIEVAEMYMSSRYDYYEHCENPCLKMRVMMENKFKEENNKNMTIIVLDKEIDLFKEHRLESPVSLGWFLFYKIYNFFSNNHFKVGEFGGYVGMIIGISLLDLEVVILAVWSVVKEKCNDRNK